jgi:hypothetical protein
MKMRRSASVLGVTAFLAAAGFLTVQYGTASATTDPQFMTVGARIQGVGSGRCLTPPASDGGTTTIQDCAGQQWSITTDGQVMAGGRCLDAYRQGTANGTVVTVWSCNGGSNQRFNLNPDGTITGVQSNRCLDVNAMLATSGTKVQLWDCNGGSNQRWVLAGGTSPTTGPTTAPPTPRPTASPTPGPSPTGTQTTAAQTVGGGTLSSPAKGPGPTAAVFGTGFTLIKNWDFGTGGTIRGIADMNKEFVYHDQFNTIGNGTNYGAITLAPDSANAISGQPVENPNNPVRQFTAGSVKTTLVPLNGATTVSPNQHNVGNGSFMAKLALPKGGPLFGHDILWETRVRYVTAKYFWFALWNSGNQWNHGAEFDVVESFGYDNGSNGTNFDGRFWHADPVGGTRTTDYTNWGAGMAAHGIKSYDPTQYHVWSLLYRTNNAFSFFVDGVEVQSGTMNWTNGATPGGQPIDFRFLFDAGWGHTQVASVNYSMPASELAGKFYEFDYSRVYER